MIILIHTITDWDGLNTEIVDVFQPTYHTLKGRRTQTTTSNSHAFHVLY